MKIELGCGACPTEGYIHCDRWKHSPHVIVAFDLEEIPWPFKDNEVEEILSVDTFEHLRPWIVDVRGWLDECWRILVPGGLLNMRLPAWDNHYSWRDPTHYRVFHTESFLYFCPDAEGTVWSQFGKFYWGEGYKKWWRQESVEREANDLRFKLRKLG